MNRSANGLFIETTTLDDFSLVNCRRFAKYAKLSRHMVVQGQKTINLCLTSNFNILNHQFMALTKETTSNGLLLLGACKQFTTLTYVSIQMKHTS